MARRRRRLLAAVSVTGDVSVSPWSLVSLIAAAAAAACVFILLYEEKDLVVDV